MAKVVREVRIGASLAAVFLILAFVCLVSLAALLTGASSPRDVWTEVDETKTADGARVTLERAYADERFVAVLLRMGRPVKYSPSLWDDTVGNEAEFAPHVQITDASGQDFDSVGGIFLPPDRTGAEAVFDAPKGLEPGPEHRFPLEVPLMEDPSGEIAKQGPLVFDFEIPVAEAPTYSVGQEVEAEGVVITLERVVDSPVLPQAVVCFEPPDAKHRWMPSLQPYPTYRSVQALLSFVGHYTAALLGKKEVWSAPQNLGDGCWSLQMDAPVEGHSSVTVEYLEGMDLGFKPKIIRGPWIFEFEVP